MELYVCKPKDVASKNSSSGLLLYDEVDPLNILPKSVCKLDLLSDYRDAEHLLGNISNVN